MSDNGSSDSDDELGLFSFANKQSIVQTPPSSPSPERESGTSEVVIDRSLFQRGKRKLLATPQIVETQLNIQNDSLDDSLNNSIDGSSNKIEEKIKDYENRVANIIDVSEFPRSVNPPKRFKQTAEKRQKLIQNLDGVLNKYKTHIPINEIPVSASTSSENIVEAPVDRPITLKLKKGNNYHRFKVTMDTPLITVLSHLAPVYKVRVEQFILQNKDETVDPNKTPRQLELTVADILELLISSSTSNEVVRPDLDPDPENVITIKVQSPSFRNNCKEYKVVKTKPLVEYLYQACKDFNYHAAKYLFDGEAIDPRKTPLQLDLEDSDCIDIVEQT